MKQKLAWAEAQRSKGLPTIPTSIGVSFSACMLLLSSSCRLASMGGITGAMQEELKINPFLRPNDPDLKAFTGKSEPVDVLYALRKAKDSFKG